LYIYLYTITTSVIGLYGHYFLNYPSAYLGQKLLNVTSFRVIVLLRPRQDIQRNNHLMV